MLRGLFFAVFLVAVAANVDSARYELESNLSDLFNLCAADSVCATRFYLESSSDSDKQKFFRLIVTWAQSDDCPLSSNSLRNRITLNDYTAEEAAWWLTVMNTAKICGDENKRWEMNRGCVANAERIGRSDVVHVHGKRDASQQPIVAITIGVSCVTILSTIVGAVFYIRQSQNSVIAKLEKLEQVVAGNGAPLKSVTDEGADEAGDEEDDHLAGMNIATEVGMHFGAFGS